MANQLILYNAKGGVGKTTVGINIAGALNRLDQSVLFVDLDPQGNATEGLGHYSAYETSSPTLLDLLIDPSSHSEIESLIVEHPEFDLLPSNEAMLNAERELVIEDYEGNDPLPNFSRALDALDPFYDYILVDSPPFFGMLSDSGLFATRNVIIPALTESTSQRAIELLLQQIERLEGARDIRVRETAAVANRIETTNEAKRMKEWIKTVFPDVPIFYVRKRVALQEAYANGESLFLHDPKCDMCATFNSVALSLRKVFQSEGAMV